MYTLPKYKIIHSLHLYAKFLYCDFIFITTNLLLSILYFILDHKLSNKHFNIHIISTPDFLTHYHIKNYPYYNSSPLSPLAGRDPGKKWDKTGHFCDIFQKKKKQLNI